MGILNLTYFSRRVILGWLAIILVVIAVFGGDVATATATPASDSDSHLVHHLLGETWVPNYPQRIVTLGNSALETAIALGMQPVGAAPWIGAGNVGDFPAYFPGLIQKNVIYLGDVNQPSLERILLLKPDLILGNFVEHRGIYSQLSHIAPTILYDFMRTTWQEVFKSYGEALGKTKEAELVINRYEKRVAEFKQIMGDNLQTQVSVVRFLPSQVRLYMKASFSGTILEDLGLARPDSQDQQKWKESISVEAIPRADGDVLFIAQSDPHSKLYQQFTKNPLWQRLGAVQSQQVYQVDYEYWIGGSGPIAANLVIDDLLGYLKPLGINEFQVLQ
ncbi:MAG: iron-siderophore ABC transporter substrate-binding protein [Spirulinaceae cyanobacterium]